MTHAVARDLACMSNMWSRLCSKGRRRLGSSVLPFLRVIIGLSLREMSQCPMISCEMIYYNAAMRLAIYGPPQHAARSTSTADEGIYKHPYVALPKSTGRIRYAGSICERNGRKKALYRERSA